VAVASSGAVVAVGGAVVGAAPAGTVVRTFVVVGGTDVGVDELAGVAVTATAPSRVVVAVG
jgi:hypothetical protein